ncbi:hypothetical protein ACFL6S_36755 [Candidatus Poribacteria bacterium]
MMKYTYNSSAKTIFLILTLVILAWVTTVAEAQLLKDTFDDPAWEERWEIHDDGTSGIPSVWSVGGGIPEDSFGTTSQILNGIGPSGADEMTGTYALTLKAGSESWSDYIFSCDLYHAGDNDYAGLMVRYADELNYVRVWSKQAEIDSGDVTTFGMDICVSGKWTFHYKLGGPGPGGDGISGTPIPAGDNITMMAWFNITVEAVGDTVTMYMEGEEMGSITDPALVPGGELAKGKIALFNTTNPTAYDNVLVSAQAVSSAGKLGTTWGILKAGYEQ